jgi:hypothetical protein
MILSQQEFKQRERALSQLSHNQLVGNTGSFIANKLDATGGLA